MCSELRSTLLQTAQVWTRDPTRACLAIYHGDLSVLIFGAAFSPDERNCLRVMPAWSRNLPVTADPADSTHHGFCRASKASPQINHDAVHDDSVGDSIADTDKETQEGSTLPPMAICPNSSGFTTNQALNQQKHNFSQNTRPQMTVAIKQACGVARRHKQTVAIKLNDQTDRAVGLKLFLPRQEQPNLVGFECHNSGY
ncbi:uncharacterized protein RCC_04678 [Ramularia collo-cygni]|uniref:Uncharacterized protein n=1 Tax=Ramularia collo-cygni TaxID=112498 RepID=A0A2D3VE06_9PEZI|nr:uncharacterized protein RCC_04678 [Ramularia collo-cygni]CZT18833.1 uncharacterized protein RCC_04678 [Ramularia collo-cygni]